MTKHDVQRFTLPACPFCGCEVFKLETRAGSFQRDRMEFICDTVYERDVRWKFWMLAESGEACERYEKQVKADAQRVGRLARSEPV